MIPVAVMQYHFQDHSPSQVQYYGLIKQATGEDWDDTRISLSTAQPSIGGSAPPLPTRIIRFKRPPPRPYYPMKAGQERFRAISSQRNERMLMDIDLECAGFDSYASSEGEEESEMMMSGVLGGVPPPPPPPGAASMPAPRAPPPALAVDTAKVGIIPVPIPGWEGDCRQLHVGHLHRNTLVTLIIIVVIKARIQVSVLAKYFLLDLNLELHVWGTHI